MGIVSLRRWCELLPSWPGLSRPSTSLSHLQRTTWMPGTRPGMTAERSMRSSHRIPREYVARALERSERGGERAFELLIDVLRRPAIRAMDRTDGARLVEQENLVAAHAEDLSGNSLRAIGGEIDRERGDFFRRHLLEPLDPGFLLRRLRRDRIDHARPRERRDAVRAYPEPRHVERDRAREPDNAEFCRHVIRLAEIADQRRGRCHMHEGAGS